MTAKIFNRMCAKTKFTNLQRSVAFIIFFLKKFIQLPKEYSWKIVLSQISPQLCKFIAESRALRPSYISVRSSDCAFFVLKSVNDYAEFSLPCHLRRSCSNPVTQYRNSGFTKNRAARTSVVSWRHTRVC